MYKAIISKFKSLFSKSELNFIHIPKTGGTYFTQKGHKTLIEGVNNLGHTVIDDCNYNINHLYYPRDMEHARLVTPIENNRNTKYISIIRNPFDWLVSYAGHAGSWNPKYTNTDHYDYEAANISFEYLLKKIVDREEVWPSRKPLFLQLFTTSGKFILDEFMDQAHLNSEIERLARKYNRDYKIEEPLRVGNRKDYRHYYTPELIDLVEETWGDELRFLGYSFGEKRKKAPIDNLLGTRREVFDPSEQKILI
ncbi:MAG: hypothetical protein ACQETE_08020 [Bacteroidota bacterium]